MLLYREQNMLKNKNTYYTYYKIMLLKPELFNRLNQQVLIVLISFKDVILLFVTINIAFITVLIKKANSFIYEILIEDL